MRERLSGSEYLVHCFNGGITALISCKLAFESQRHIVIRNGADGQSLILDECEPEEMDLGEYGSTRLASSLEYDPANSRPCIGRRLDRCRLLLGGGDAIRAIELSFEGNVISFRNRDDDLVVEPWFGDTNAWAGLRIVEMS